MKRGIQYLLKGLTILLPLVVTIALVHWFLVTIESWLRPIWESILGTKYYFPGLAFLSFLVLAIIIGFSARWRFINKLWELPGNIMQRMPVLRSLYGTITDVFDLMSGKSFSDESVVLVTLPGVDVKLIGIVTKKPGQKEDRLSAMLDENHIAVFLPMSYNVGGYMIIVPRDSVEALDMSPADAMQLTISGGLGKNRQNSEDNN
ncbi:DUF502 domain-containing protein [Pseudidiomarina tainanensis]|uniref:Uncharacterized membrane protein n=2 Tax=Pseudidiomarina TaxID=2800384 RepID=A0A1I6HKU2_9GAMM|nr:MULTISPECIES: DUF502 domain-containing protein [Pseudidiomarina]RZQ55892.1 DUF502 domain-containing protein [Pseudidiomarina tainanensis]SFR55079.1 Uncharacterized membrane protein [Pseudidiomarina maritima]